MKKSALFILFLGFSFFVFSQFSKETLIKKRDSVYQAYKAHKDTMTIRTWLNVITMNKHLETLRSYDSLIKNVLDENQRKQNSVLFDLQDENDQLTNDNEILKIENSVLLEKIRENKTFIIIMIVISAIIVLSLIVLIFMIVRINSRHRKQEKQTKEYHTKLFAANKAIEKYDETEKKLASEINRINTKLGEEKLMFENQIIEVKKAYELEVRKRMEIEGEEYKSDHQLKNENIQLAEDLTKAKNNYENEVKTRLHIEEELKILLEKLKKQYL